jgi:hypothetical protein
VWADSDKLAPVKASVYITVEQVCGKLAAEGVDERQVSKVFAARLKPQNLEDPDHLYTMGCVAGGDPVFPERVYLVVFKFGLGKPMIKKSPLDEDSGPDWRPRFVSVQGPFPGREPTESAKDFAARIDQISEGITSG